MEFGKAILLVCFAGVSADFLGVILDSDVISVRGNTEPRFSARRVRVLRLFMLHVQGRRSCL